MYLPLCICNGLIRSGSTWSFNVCRQLMQRVANFHKRPFASTYLHSPALDAFIVKQWPLAPGPTVIKAHELGPIALDHLNRGNARGVCTFRDLRDALASDMVFIGRGFSSSIHRVTVSLECLRACESAGHVLFVRYEDMMSKRLDELRRVARHLGINLDPIGLSQIDSRTNITNSRQVCEKIRSEPNPEILTIDSHRVDPQTHLHENHIGNARVGRWKDELTAEQARHATELFSGWLLKWGYETQESLGRYFSNSARDRSLDVDPLTFEHDPALMNTALNFLSQ